MVLDTDGGARQAIKPRRRRTNGARGVGVVVVVGDKII